MQTWANETLKYTPLLLSQHLGNQPKNKTPNVLKQQDYKGKPAAKFLEALKKVSRIKKVQKEFIAADKQPRCEPRRVVP